jgi:nucleoside-diphosphate-sugar epimerase
MVSVEGLRYETMARPLAGRKRTLVFGASGFIGRRVVQALLESDWATPVAAVHRAPLALATPVESVQLDATDRFALQAALHGIDSVVSAIGGDPATILASARALFAACRDQSPPPRVVHLSTMLVYANTSGTVDESAALRGDYGEYSQAKVRIEDLASSYPAVVHLRPGIVYGPESPLWSGDIGQWLLAHRLGDLGEAGRGWCNLAYIDDVAAAVCSALRVRGIEGEAFNIVMSAPPTWNEYLRQFAAALGTSCVRISPARLALELRGLAPPLKLAELAARAMGLKWRPPAPLRPWLLRQCAYPMRLDSKKAELKLGLRWTALGQGLERSASWALARRVAA